MGGEEGETGREGATRDGEEEAAVGSYREKDKGI
jgi:hypothetical protein